jgi:hypothetical protein
VCARERSVARRREGSRALERREEWKQRRGGGGAAVGEVEARRGRRHRGGQHRWEKSGEPSVVVWEGGKFKVVGRKGMMCGSHLSLC